MNDNPKIDLEPVNSPDSTPNKGVERLRKIAPEIFVLLWNKLLFDFELNRDAAHGDSEGLVSQGSGNLTGHEFGKLPLATDGVWGFVDQHIGDSLETLELIYAWRIPIELVAKAVEIYGNKKIDPRIKIGTSILLGVLSASAAEFKFSNGDPLDLFGPVVAGIWAASEYGLVNELFSGRMSENFNKTWAKMTEAATKMKGITKEKLETMEKWGAGLMEVGKDKANTFAKWVGEKGEEHANMIRMSGEYVDMELRIAQLRLDDFQNRQLRRIENIDKGNIGEEG